MAVLMLDLDDGKICVDGNSRPVIRLDLVTVKIILRETRDGRHQPHARRQFRPDQLRGRRAASAGPGRAAARARRHAVSQRPQPAVRAAPIGAAPLVRRRRHGPRLHHRGRPRQLPQPLGPHAANGRPSTPPAAPLFGAFGNPTSRRSVGVGRTAASPTPTSSGTPAGCWRWRKATCRSRSIPARSTLAGYVDFGGALDGPFTAHPKIDPVTGELVFFGYSLGRRRSADGMTYGAIDASGRVTRFERFEAPYCQHGARLHRDRPSTCCSRSCRSPAAWSAP